MNTVSFLGAVVEGEPTHAANIERVLTDAFPEVVRAFVHAAEVKVVALKPGQGYRDVSRGLRRLSANVDDWPVPPAGLFVIEERTVYLRSTSPMTIVHEYAHALDCALGGGVYLSGLDPKIRAAFRCAASFTTPYAASGLDEFFAECVRAYVEGNDDRSPWPRATRARLRACNPDMVKIIEGLFAGCAA